MDGKLNGTIFVRSRILDLFLEKVHLTLQKHVTYFHFCSPTKARTNFWMFAVTPVDTQGNRDLPHARSGKQARAHKHILESVGSALPLRVRMLAGHCERKAFCLGSLKLVIAP